MSESTFDASNNGYDPKNNWSNFWKSTDDDGNDIAETSGLPQPNHYLDSPEEDARLADDLSEHTKAWQEKEKAKAEGLKSDPHELSQKPESAPAVAVVTVRQDNPLSDSTDKKDSPLSFREAFKAAREKAEESGNGDDGRFDWTDKDGKVTSIATILKKPAAQGATAEKPAAPVAKAVPVAIPAAASNPNARPPYKNTTPQVTAVGTYAGKRPNGQAGAPGTTNYTPMPDAPKNLAFDEFTSKPKSAR